MGFSFWWDQPEDGCGIALLKLEHDGFMRSQSLFPALELIVPDGSRWH